MKLYFIKQKT